MRWKSKGLTPDVVADFSSICLEQLNATGEWGSERI